MVHEDHFQKYFKTLTNQWQGLIQSIPQSILDDVPINFNAPRIDSRPPSGHQDADDKDDSSDSMSYLSALSTSIMSTGSEEIVAFPPGHEYKSWANVVKPKPRPPTAVPKGAPTDEGTAPPVSLSPLTLPGSTATSQVSWLAEFQKRLDETHLVNEALRKEMLTREEASRLRELATQQKMDQLMLMIQTMFASQGHQSAQTAEALETQMDIHDTPEKASTKRKNNIRTPPDRDERYSQTRLTAGG
jgi:hypothetical protein